MEPNREQWTRRQWLAGAAGVGAGLSLAACATNASNLMPIAAPGRHIGENDKIHVGIIGCGSMGTANLDNCAKQPDVVITALCDVWQARLDPLAERFKATAKTYRDHRELLAAKDVDAVIIATPPHWHTIQAIDACRAGKDIYLQKPMTLYPDESLAVRNAVRRHGRICQVGTQIHANQNFRRVVETVRSGRLGKIASARTFNVMNQGPEGIGNAPSGPLPKDLDWERWVGPAPMREFHELIVRDAYYHGSFWDYSGGWTPGMAPHVIDLPHWALGLGIPTVTTCTGGRFVLRDVGDVPDVQEMTWLHPNCTLAWSTSLVNSFGFDFGRGTRGRRLGVYFHGINGTLFSDYGKHEIVAEGDLLGPVVPVETIPPSPGHEREWLDCIRSRQQPSCNPDYHVGIDMAIALGNLAYRLGRSVRFDPATERIVGDPEAAAMARPKYRAPWQFPAEYL